MSQIKQLLRLHKVQTPIKRIARELGISKNTVKGYLAKLREGGHGIDALLALEDPVLEGVFHSGNPAYKDPRYEHMSGRLAYFERELGKTGVTKHLLWEEYIQAFPGGYGYSQFCHHLRQRLVSLKPSMIIKHEPGDKLFIDFAGKKLHYTDRSTGEMVACQVFVACLPFSDYGFATVVPSQRMEDFLYALDKCLRYLGGVPRALVPDNLKSAVTRPDRYEPDISMAMDDFANHYDTVVVPARVRKPKDKALVENHVQIIYTRVFAKLRNRQFFDIHSLDKAVGELMEAHNQTRMQRRPYCRRERFLAAEKGLLNPLPVERYQVRYYSGPKVAPNGHVSVGRDRHMYSVPYGYIGQCVKVIYTRTKVAVYFDGKQIASHLRCHGPGYTTVKEHLCSHHRHYLDRSPAYYIEQARKKGPELHLLVQRLFDQDRYPETQYRTCDGLLRLQRQSEPAAFARACEVALDHGIFSYQFIQKLLESGMPDNPGTIGDIPLPAHGNIRGKAYFAQTKLDL